MTTPCTPEELERIKDDLQGGPRRRIKQLADDLGVTVEELMDHAAQRLSDDWHYWVHEQDSGRFESKSIPSYFWDDYELVKHVAVPADKRGNFLSCSC